MAAEKTYRAGIIGVGRKGHGHARGYAGNPRTEVVAAADAGSVHIPPDMPAFDALPPEEDRRAGIEPLRLRVFDWQDGQLSVKTLAAEPPAAFAVI